MVASKSGSLACSNNCATCASIDMVPLDTSSAPCTTHRIIHRPVVRSCHSTAQHSTAQHPHMQYTITCSFCCTLKIARAASVFPTTPSSPAPCAPIRLLLITLCGTSSSSTSSTSLLCLHALRLLRRHGPRVQRIMAEHLHATIRQPLNNPCSRNLTNTARVHTSSTVSSVHGCRLWASLRQPPRATAWPTKLHHTCLRRQRYHLMPASSVYDVSTPILHTA